jgi:hypothetical protein
MAVASLLAAGPLSAQSAAPVPPDLNDRGTFQILLGEKNIGTENFEIRVRSNQIEAQADVHLQVEQSGKKMDVRTTANLLLDPQLNPLSYTWNQKGAQASQLSIDFHTKPAQAHYKTVGGQEDRRDFQLVKDVVVLDDNSVHQYQLAVARYDKKKGGTQTFHAFVPQEAAPGQISLKSLGAQPVAVGGDVRTLQGFLLTTELTQISLFVDDEGHLQMVDAPGLQFQAIRKK